MNSITEKQKVESRKQKWAETGKSETENQKVEIVKAEMERQEAKNIPEWWTVVPDGERRVIQAMMGLLRCAKHSKRNDVAWAGRKWGLTIGCFIKTRLIAENGRAARRRQRWKCRGVGSGSGSGEGRSTEKRREA